jgi:hypothetical protein
MAEAVLQLRWSFGEAPFVDRACERVLAALQKAPVAAADDDGAEALRHEIVRDLDRAHRMDEPLRQQLARATLRAGGARGDTWCGGRGISI